MRGSESTGLGERGWGLAPGRWAIGVEWALLIGLASFFVLMPGMDGRADGDFWWHIQYGMKSLREQAIPQTDWLSWTKEGAPYTVTQWLGQVLLGGAWMLGGWQGTGLLTLGCTVLIIVGAYGATRPWLGAGWVGMVLVLALTTPFWSNYARPQMFGFVSMALLVWWSELVRRDGWTKKSLCQLGLLMGWWVNCHGSFVVGVLYLAMSWASAEVGRFLRVASDARGGSPWLERKWVGAAMGVAILGTLANPEGWGAWGYAADVARLKTTLMGVVAEWTPTALSSAAGQTFILTYLSLLVVWAISTQRPEIEDVVLTLALIMIGLIAVRQTAFATIALVPIVARTAARMEITKRLQALGPSRVGARWWVSAALVGLAMGQAQAGWRERGLQEWQRKVFPVDATAFIKQEGITGRLFNEATAGGWMSYHSGMKVSIDGRLDLHRDFEYFDWYFTRQAAPGWQNRVARLDPEVFVVQTQTPMVNGLMQSGLAALVYTDERYSVLVKRVDRFSDLIRRREIKTLDLEILDKDGNVKPSLCGW